VFESQQGIIYYRESAGAPPSTKVGNAAGQASSTPYQNTRRLWPGGRTNGFRQVPDVRRVRADPATGSTSCSRERWSGRPVVRFHTALGLSGSYCFLLVLPSCLINQDSRKKKGLREVGFANPASNGCRRANKFEAAAKACHDPSLWEQPSVRRRARAGTSRTVGEAMDGAGSNAAWVLYIKGGGALNE